MGWLNDDRQREIDVSQKWRTLFISSFAVVLRPVSNRIYVVSVPGTATREGRGVISERGAYVENMKGLVQERG